MKTVTRTTHINWRALAPTKYGCPQWQSADGMFLLVCSDRHEDIPMPRLWILWQWKRGSWWKVAERRSRNVIEKIARHRAAELEEE